MITGDEGIRRVGRPSIVAAKIKTSAKIPFPSSNLLSGRNQRRMCNGDDQRHSVALVVANLCDRVVTSRRYRPITGIP